MLSNSYILSNTGSGVLAIGNAIVNNSHIINNISTSYAGGIDVFGNAIINNSKIVNNTSESNAGGIYSGVSIIINSSSIISNTSSNSYGGGVHGSLTIEVNDSLIADNSAKNGGGGVHNFGDSSYPYEPSVVINNSIIRNNSSGSDGGGIKSSISYIININNSTIISNTSDNNGGGIAAHGILINNSYIKGNYATGNGGGIKGSGTISNSVISGNYAEYGGGVSGSEVTLINTSVSGNAAQSEGGGLHVSGRSFLVNSIIWNNLDSTGIGTLSASLFNSADVLSVQHSLLQGSGGSSNWNPDAGIDEGGNLDIDPLFYTPIDSEAAPILVGDLRLLEESPAIDVGNNNANVLSTDLAGNPRIQGGVIDLGAYEGETPCYFITPNGCQEAAKLFLPMIENTLFQD